MKYNFEKRNLAEIAKEVVNELKTIAKQKGLEIKFKSSKNIPSAKIDNDSIRLLFASRTRTTNAGHPNSNIVFLLTTALSTRTRA